MLRKLVVLLGFTLASALHAGSFELLSQAGTQSDTATGLGLRYPLYPQNPAISADGRWVAFNSTAVNLAAGQRDPDAVPNVFLHDRQTGTTVLVSHAAGAPSAGADSASSLPPSISDDGRWIVYESTADNLVPGQTVSFTFQVFLYDRETGVNRLVSRSTAGPAIPANGWSGWPKISGDGSWIVFASLAADLIPGQADTASSWDVFLQERGTGETLLVSRAAGTALTAGNASSDSPAVSQDGRWVAFESKASNLIPGFSGTTDPPNVFLFDRMAGGTTLVSHTSGSALTGAGGWVPRISPDGAAVVYGSLAPDLVPGQTDTPSTSWDLFLFDRASGGNVLVSHTDASPTTCGGASTIARDFQPSAGGDWVAFSNWDDPGDPVSHIRLFRRSDSSITLVDRSAAAPTQPGNQNAWGPRITPDGAFVAFVSAATDLVDGQGGAGPYNVFLFDRAAGTLVLASGAGGSGQTGGNGPSDGPVVSEDGSTVAWYTWATDLVPGVADLNGTVDVALYDRSTAGSSLATLHAPGEGSATASTHSSLLSASADGRYALLLSAAVNLVPGQVDTNGSTDVLLIDRVAGTAALVSHAAGSGVTAGNGPAIDAAISADGAWVAFSSRSTDHVPGQMDTNFDTSPDGSAGGADVFLYERATGAITLVSHAADSSVTTGVFESLGNASLSADGRYVAYVSYAGNLVAGQAGPLFQSNVFLYDRVAGTTTLVSRQAGTLTSVAGNGSYVPVISGDGQWVLFLSLATDLVSGQVDFNGQFDLFLFDRTSGQTLLVSRAANTAATAADMRSGEAALSADGRHVVFSSWATDLVPGQTGVHEQNIFLFDRVTGTVELISRAAGTATTTVAGSSYPSVSDDGRFVAFLSVASNLVPGQIPGSPNRTNVFVHDRVTRQTELLSRSASSPLRGANGHALQPTLSPDGRFVAFLSLATDIAAGSTGRDFYLADRQLHTLERVATGPGVYFEVVNPPPATRPLLSTGGGAVLFTGGDPDLVPDDFNGADDVFAWVRGGASTGDFFTVGPCRLLDTRQASQGPALASGVPALVQVHGACGIPDTATAVAVNVTVVQPQGSGRLNLHPGNLSPPNTSTLNFKASQNLANNAILALASNGEGTLGITPTVSGGISGGGTVHVIVDVSGWFE
jgi:Tol biopolymer transport system component